MLPNLGKLSGKTVLVTGASRGIGKAIALKCAKDGANVVIAAKTVVPHPKLSGTIYTAAKEIEEAGGKCLPCEVDMRDEHQVKKAVQGAVDQFGGIDVLVNNASALVVTGTEDTTEKKFDLMVGVNMRGTFLCSKYCIPYLRKSKNPHILNISPPLSMKSKWFETHVVYSMTKYCMSMCALGMCEELRPDGIAVNTLWPRTTVYTAALEFLGGGRDDVKEMCRKPDIMADAAYAMLTKDSRSFTGNFCIDDDVLHNEGIKDFTPYSYDPKGKLVLDFFVDGTGPSNSNIIDIAAVSSLKQPTGNPTPGKRNMSTMAMHARTYSTRVTNPYSTSASRPYSTDSSAQNPQLEATFKSVQELVSPELVKTIGGLYQFDFKGLSSSFVIDLKAGSGWAGPGPAKSKPDVVMTLDAGDFVKMFNGKLNPTTAFMTGKLKIKGDMGLAMKLEKLLKKSQQAK